MATYTVKDEKTGNTVTFLWDGKQPPTDSDLENVFSEAEKYKKPEQAAQTVQPQQDQVKANLEKLASQRGTLENILAGMGRGMYNTLYMGPKQRLTEIFNPSQAPQLAEQVASERKLMAPIANKSLGFRGGELAGNVAATAPIPGGVGGNMLVRALTAAGAGAGTGFLQPTTPNESALTNTLVGGVTGGGASGAMSVVGKGANAILNKMRNPQVQTIEDLAKKYKIPVSSGESSGNAFLQRLETMGERFPFIGTYGFREKQNKMADQAAKTFLAKYMVDPDSPAAMETNRSFAKGMYQQFKSILAPVADKPILPNETKATAEKLLSRYPDLFDTLQDQKMKTVLGDIVSSTTVKGNQVVNAAPRELTFDELWTLRQGVGDLIGQARKKLASGDVNETQLGQLRKLFGAADRDMESWAGALGKPEITSKFKDANEAYRKYVVKYDILQRVYDKASYGQEMFSPKKFSNELYKTALKDKQLKRFAPGEIDEMTGLANIMSVVKRAGQYKENVPTADRWAWLLGPAFGIGIMGGADTAMIAGGATLGLKFLTTTTPGKRMLLAASKMEPNSPQMKVLTRQLYNQIPKLNAVMAEQAMREE